MASAPVDLPTAAQLLDGWLSGGILTARQWQILTGLAADLQQTEIAAVLNVAHETVKTYARQLYEMLGARNAANAVAIAYQRGILR